MSSVDTEWPGGHERKLGAERHTHLDDGAAERLASLEAFDDRMGGLRRFRCDHLKSAETHLVFR